MTDSRFSNAYKESVNSIMLPENFKDNILSHLDFENIAPKKETKKEAKKQKTKVLFFPKSIVSVAAAVIIIACAVLLFSVFRQSPALPPADFTFRISSATNLASIGGAKVTFRTSDGEYLKNEDGTPLTAYTDENGQVTATLPETENLQIEVSAEGFIPFVGNAEENVYICPEMTPDTYRAVLTWTGDCDLDAVLTHTTEKGVDRLYYFNSDILNEQGEVIAALDTDSEIPSTPETITFKAEGDGLWRMNVGSYSSLKDKGSLPLGRSGAKVTLYKGDSLVDEYSIDSLSFGNVWRVFEIKEGKLTVSNTTYSVVAMTDIQ